MAWCECIIAAQTNVNAETDVLAAIAGTSLTTRTGYGKPKITHAIAFVDTDDINAYGACLQATTMRTVSDRERQPLFWCS